MCQQHVNVLVNWWKSKTLTNICKMFSAQTKLPLIMFQKMIGRLKPDHRKSKSRYLKFESHSWTKVNWWGRFLIKCTTNKRAINLIDCLIQFNWRKPRSYHVHSFVWNREQGCWICGTIEDIRQQRISWKIKFFSQNNKFYQLKIVDLETDKRLVSTQKFVTHLVTKRLLSTLYPHQMLPKITLKTSVFCTILLIIKLLT